MIGSLSLSKASLRPRTYSRDTRDNLSISCCNQFSLQVDGHIDAHTARFSYVFNKDSADTIRRWQQLSCDTSSSVETRSKRQTHDRLINVQSIGGIDPLVRYKVLLQYEHWTTSGSRHDSGGRLKQSLTHYLQHLQRLLADSYPGKPYFGLATSLFRNSSLDSITISKGRHQLERKLHSTMLFIVSPIQTYRGNTRIGVGRVCCLQLSPSVFAAL